MGIVDAKVTGDREVLAMLTRAHGKALDETEAVVKKGCLNIKNDWAQRWSGLAHAPAVGASINFDVFYTLTAVNGEVGADKGKRQGALANLIEFGSVNNGPIPGGLPALQAEQPRFEKALEDLALRLLD